MPQVSERECARPRDSGLARHGPGHDKYACPRAADSVRPEQLQPEHPDGRPDAHPDQQPDPVAAESGTKPAQPGEEPDHDRFPRDAGADSDSAAGRSPDGTSPGHPTPGLRPRPERTGVVEGKSVDVRVDSGGRLSIHKKNNKNKRE